MKGFFPDGEEGLGVGLWLQEVFGGFSVVEDLDGKGWDGALLAPGAHCVEVGVLGAPTRHDLLVKQHAAALPR